MSGVFGRHPRMTSGRYPAAIFLGGPRKDFRLLPDAPSHGPENVVTLPCCHLNNDPYSTYLKGTLAALRLTLRASCWGDSTVGDAPLHSAYSMSKKLGKRARVKAKTHGNCAYCGIPLGDKFHVDHLRSVYSHRSYGQVGWNDEANLFAACAPCNLYKSDLSLDDFRARIERVHGTYVKRAGYRALLRFNGIFQPEAPITFYFETLNNG